LAISNAPWDGSASNYDDTDHYCSVCLIDMNPSGETKVQKLCKLPVYEPDGDLNRSAVHSAAAVLSGAMGGVQAPLATRQEAARKLVKLYGQLGETPGESTKALAGS
jgi:hypothetical protein